MLDANAKEIGRETFSPLAWCVALLSCLLVHARYFNLKLNLNLNLNLAGVHW